MDLLDGTVGTVRIGDRVVRRLGFGAARVSGARDTSGRRDRELGRELCRRAYERGVNFIDVAAVYGRGECEEIVGEALAPHARDVLIASKAGMVSWRDEQSGRTVTGPDGRPETIKAQCDDSLRRLRLDHIELYQIHAPDPKVPWEETVGAFRDLQQVGKIGHIGLSNVSVEQLAAAEAVAPIAAVQNRYTVADRESEPVLEACHDRGIPFLPYSPNLLGDTRAAEVVAEIADAHGVSPQQVGVRWLLHHNVVMLPIPGTTRLAHVDDNIDLAWLALGQDELARLDALGTPTVPH